MVSSCTKKSHRTPTYHRLPWTPGQTAPKPPFLFIPSSSPFCFHSSLMSHFNHPCITTPACIPSPPHLAFCSTSSLSHTLRNIHSPSHFYHRRAPITTLVSSFGSFSAPALEPTTSYYITSCFQIFFTPLSSWPSLIVFPPKRSYWDEIYLIRRLCFRRYVPSRVSLRHYIPVGPN